MPSSANHESIVRGAPAVSATIICLNEEALIASCLARLDWCDEIVVVDSGSTDRTIEIVSSFPKTRLFHRDFDTYINQKNFALDQCNHDWVLSLDADEILTKELIAEFVGLNYDVAGYQLQRKTFLGDQEIHYGNWNPDYVLRLFRRSLCRWGGTNPHETVKTEHKIGRLHSPLMHYSYASRDEFITRNRHYASMMVEHLLAEGVSSTTSRAVAHGFGNFLKAYLLRRGILDGADGLFLAWHGAKASYIKHSELARRTAA